MTVEPSSRPSLSLAERDRRWAAVRALMRDRQLDCLLVAGFRSRELYDAYLSDDFVDGAVIFPLESEPVVITWGAIRVLRAYNSAQRGNPLWIEDYRVVASGAAAAIVVREKGLDGGRLGVVGLRSQASTENRCVIPYTWWKEFTEALPGLTVDEVYAPFCDIMLGKSDEELELVQYAADASEAAAQVMLDVAEPGVGEEIIWAEIMREIYRRGVSLHYPGASLHSGTQNLSWGPPRWLTRAEQPHRLQRGDLIQSEIMATYGNYESQAQMAVALDPVDEIVQRCEPVARAAYEAGVQAIRPGVAFADVVSAMEEPLKRSGCWALSPLIHSLNPHYLSAWTAINTEHLDLGVRVVDDGSVSPPRSRLPLRAGMVFTLKPDACIDRHRVHLGGTVVVTETGCRELNVLSTRISHK